MLFKTYQHIERLGTDPVKDILNGTVYVFSKLDGTNTGIRLNEAGEISVNSRNRELSLIDDNQGACAYVLSQEKFKKYFEKHPNHYLYGEYLIRNHIKDYEVNAWKKVYIFDVVEYNEDGTHRCLTYEEYMPLLKEFDIEYIPLIAKLENPTEEEILALQDKCLFLMQDDHIGEGIVVKRYDFINQYNHHIWAKVVRQQYKVQKSQKQPVINSNVETQIIENLFTPEFIEKEYCKIINDNEGKWDSKLISKLLGVLWHTFIIEESWNIIKKYKNPTVNYKLLNRLATEKIKKVKKELF